MHITKKYVNGKNISKGIPASYWFPEPGTTWSTIKAPFNLNDICVHATRTSRFKPGWGVARASPFCNGKNWFQNFNILLIVIIRLHPLTRPLPWTYWDLNMCPQVPPHPHNVRGPESTCRSHGHKWTQDPWRCEGGSTRLILYSGRPPMALNCNIPGQVRFGDKYVCVGTGVGGGGLRGLYYPPPFSWQRERVTYLTCKIGGV